MQSLIRRYAWAIPVLTIMGFVASLAEGIGIGIFVPFLGLSARATLKGGAACGSLTQAW
ncbi:MAG TPA: hypothetical protein VGO93_03545 [Candidatus Xenobia bacterium]|jgi:hypothetical protein